MDRDAARTKARTALRRGIAKVGTLDRLVLARNERLRRGARLIDFYNRLRAAYTDVAAPPQVDDRPGLPAPADVEVVEAALLDAKATNDFVQMLTREADVDRAMKGLVSRLLDSGDLRRARSIAQVLRHRDGLQALGDICLAVVVMREPLFEESWELFRRNDVWHVLRLASMEFFEVGFKVDPGAACDVLDRTLDGQYPLHLPAHCWVQLAQWAFAVRDEKVSARAADRAASLLGNGPRAAELRAELDALRAWYGRLDAAHRPASLSDGEIPFAVLDYQEAGRPASPPEDADAQNSLVALGNLARHKGIRYRGDLSALADSVRARVPADQLLESSDATVRLYSLDRDASSYAAVPDGTWLIASGEFVRPVFGLRRDFPLHPHLRPIFLGFEIRASSLLTPGAVDYLRRYAPVGCRDWQTVFLLQAAGIPAFFSGWLTATADLVTGEPSFKAQPISGPFAERIMAAADDAHRLRGRAESTGKTHTYVFARAAGATVTFRPHLPNDGALHGLADIDDAEFAAQARSTKDVLAAVVGAIAAGKDEDDVYSVWREVCAPLVAAASAERDTFPPIPPPTFDVAAAVQQTHAASVVVERSAPGPAGPEINVELSLDGNYKHQLDVVLDSIVAHASRPIRAFVLCRDHTQDDFDRMARLFPTVSFVWLPTDKADYGPIAHMLGHITVATMDRLLLPELLPDVDRIIHHDLDALCMADLAELFDLPVDDVPLAARDQRHPFFGSGYIAMTRGLPRAQSREKSRELMIRLSRQQPFDYRNFNAGVMVLNLARMRADEFVRYFLPYVERFGFNDQGVLNIYAGGQRYDFARAWNRYPRMEIADDAKILHWIGGDKPWQRIYIEGQQHWRGAEARFAERERAANAK